MHGITNYIFVDDDKHIISEIGFLDDLPAENYCGQLSVDLKTTITCYKEVCVLDYVKARAAEQRNGAVAVGQKCPFCEGTGNTGSRVVSGYCRECNGAGHF
jgi:hypothetical protein